jgi:PAS domain S-box-containing protein
MLLNYLKPFKFKKRIALIFIILLAVVIGNSWVFYQNINQIVVNEEQGSTSRDIISTLLNIGSAFKDIEKAKGYFLLTQDPMYEQDILNSSAFIEDKLTHLTQLTQERKYTDLRDQLRLKLNQRLVNTTELIGLYKRKGYSHVRGEIQSAANKKEVEEIENTLWLLQRAEEEELAFATEKYQVSIQSTLATFAGATSLTIALLLLGYYLLQKDYRQRQKIREIESRYRKLIDGNIIGVMIASLEGKITDANESFLHIIGYSHKELADGKISWREITPARYRPIDEVAVKQLKKSGTAAPWEKEFVRKDGTTVPVLAGAAMLDDSQDEAVAFVIDITEQKEVEERLRESKDQLEIIFQNVADGITVQDTKGKLIYVNEAAAQASGFSSREEMLRVTPQQMMSIVQNRFVITNKEGKEITIQDLPGREALSGKFPPEITVGFYDKETDQQRWSLIKARPIFDEDGNVQLAVNIITDITESKELERRKDEFLSIASHELKTPLTTIKAYVQLLEQYFKKQKEDIPFLYLEKIDAYIHKLTGLIGDLLDVSKIQAGKLQFNTEVFEFDPVVKNCIDDIQPTTKSHKIIRQGYTRQKIKGDVIRIEQVINNLLTNAIKYSPGADKVIVRSEVKGKNIILSVQDFGIGIDEEHQNKIFEKFYRSDEVTKGFSGLGIGLFLSQEITLRHHGKIWVKSKKNHGSTFFISIPIAKPTKTQKK